MVPPLEGFGTRRYRFRGRLRDGYPWQGCAATILRVWKWDVTSGTAARQRLFGIEVEDGRVGSDGRRGVSGEVWVSTFEFWVRLGWIPVEKSKRKGRRGGGCAVGRGCGERGEWMLRDVLEFSVGWATKRRKCLFGAWENDFRNFFSTIACCWHVVPSTTLPCSAVAQRYSFHRHCFHHGFCFSVNSSSLPVAPSSIESAIVRN